MARDLLDAGDDDVAESLADRLDPLDHQAEVVQGRGELGRVTVERGEVSEPGKGNPHCCPLGSARASELAQETDVVLDERPHVGDLVAHLRAPVDAEPEGEAGPLVGVDADGVEHGRVDHAAPAELDPPRLGAGPAAVAAADGARDLELGRRLGEGEVGRAQAGVDVGPK